MPQDIAPSVAKYRARIAGLSRDRSPDDPDLAEARQNLRAAKLEAHIQKAVAEASPLSDEQRDRIVAILRSGAA